MSPEHGSPVGRYRPEYWAIQTPERAAVVDGDAVLTYAEWNARADRLAGALSALGPDVGSVAVRMHQRPEWFVLILALAKLQGEVVSISWRLTPHEVDEAVRDSGARVLVVDDEDDAPIRAALAGAGVRVIGLAAGGPEPSFEELVSTPLEQQPYRSRGPAPLLTYSSGTTGRARGVRNPTAKDRDERAVLLDYLGITTPVTPKQATRMVAVPRTLLTLPLHHGIGPKSASSCHDRGGTVYLLDRFDAATAIAMIERHRITHWTTVPTMLRKIRALPADVLEATDVRSMRMLSVGSAPSSEELRAWTIGYFGNCLYEGYGASEVGMVTLMRPRWRAGRPGSCGRLRRHVSVRIQDPDGAELPRGGEGEIWVQTPVTIDRYVNDGPLDGSMLSADGHFRTGDIGRLDDDDFLYITGRAKDMIVAGGVNIYPAEIETVLAEHPDVVEAAVFGVPEDTFGEQVMAVCEARPGAHPSGADVLDFVAGRIAAFKRPRIVEFVDELPRNTMGKVTKHVLREPHWRDRPLAI